MGGRRHVSAEARREQTLPGAKGLEEETVTKQLRGFATMDVTKQREIARMGGKAAHAKGTAHEWSREQARLAGHKGGLARARRMEPIIAARKKNQP
jgi:general stress protein YciG